MKRSRLTLQFERAQFPENQQKLQNIDASNERHHASEASSCAQLKKGDANNNDCGGRQKPAVDSDHGSLPSGCSLKR
jgi:hypothetical protein